MQSKTITAIGECTTNVLIAVMLFFVLCSFWPICAVQRHRRKRPAQAGSGCLSVVSLFFVRSYSHGLYCVVEREVATFGWCGQNLMRVLLRVDSMRALYTVEILM
jgi:hypothetical protein